MKGHHIATIIKLLYLPFIGLYLYIEYAPIGGVETFLKDFIPYGPFWGVIIWGVWIISNKHLKSDARSQLERHIWKLEENIRLLSENPLAPKKKLNDEIFRINCLLSERYRRSKWNAEIRSLGLVPKKTEWERFPEVVRWGLILLLTIWFFDGLANSR